MKKKINGREYLTVKDVASILGYSEDHIRRLCRSRKISYYKLFNKYYFEEAYILSLLKKY